ncbi:hypothetical protein ACCO45_008073 [Purpureocillium lilacinum]|uniref:Uncharacterized protein n=1 Tax=Purpureocillium lilacinum TaxID=33203 RepID=A0ACC4DM82_PURLI
MLLHIQSITYLPNLQYGTVLGPEQVTRPDSPVKCHSLHGQTDRQSERQSCGRSSQRHARPTCSARRPHTQPPSDPSIGFALAGQPWRPPRAGPHALHAELRQCGGPVPFIARSISSARGETHAGPSAAAERRVCRNRRQGIGYAMGCHIHAWTISSRPASPPRFPQSPSMARPQSASQSPRDAANPQKPIALVSTRVLAELGRIKIPARATETHDRL